MKYRVGILLCVLAFIAKSQNVKEDVMKINEAYTKFNDLSMFITYNLYANYSATLPAETETGSFKQHGDLRYSKLKGIESLQNKDYLVVADNSEQIIVVGNPVKFNTKKITLLDLDKAFTACSTVKFLTNNATQNGYKLTFKSNITSEYDIIDLYFNKKTFIVEKMVFYYRQAIRINESDKKSLKEKPKLEIIFSSMNFKQITDNDFYSEKRFIEKRKDSYFPVGAYRKYKLINQKF